MKKFISVLLCTALMISFCSVMNGLFTVEVAAATPNYTCEVWKRAEIVLNSTVEYKNPYTSCEINAVFTHEDGTKISIPGFWYGGDEWHVRFSPTKTGTWNYTITCTDATNTGLNNVTGSVLATENTGKTEVDKHGFVTISSDKRTYAYADGTPFFWLGDTNWQAPNYVSLTSCNYPGSSSNNQFKFEVDNRVAKGFTVYQTYFDTAESDGGGQKGKSQKSIWTTQFTKPNTDVFNNKIDSMFDYLGQTGMTIALGFGVHASTMTHIKEEDYLRFVRYCVARYGAYSIVWITGQEITNNDDSMTTGKSVMTVYMDGEQLADNLDGYNHPNGSHMYCIPYDDLRCQRLEATTWHDSWIIQSGHGAKVQTKEYYQKFYVNTGKNNKPLVEAEANYEDINCGGFTGYNANRYSAWKAIMCGCAGFTYGVTGIWANCYSNVNNTGWLGSYSYGPWYMGLDKPGSFEVSYMKNFFEKVGWYDLVPRYTTESYASFAKDETKCLSSTEDASTAVCYFCNTDTTTGTLYKLDDSKTYHALWFNPLTGNFVEVSNNVKTSGGKYEIPAKPDNGDWAFLLTTKDLGQYNTEAPYTELANKDGNTVSGSVVVPSSVSAIDGQYYDSKSKLINVVPYLYDMNTSTSWKPLESRPTDTIIYDLGSICTLTNLVMMPTVGYYTPSYRIECSADGVNWTILTNRTNTAPSTITSGTYKYVCENLKGNYRYVKILLLNPTTQKSAATDFKCFNNEVTEDYYYLKSIDEITVYASATGLDISQASGNVTTSQQDDTQTSTGEVVKMTSSLVPAITTLPAVLTILGAVILGAGLAVTAIVLAKPKTKKDE